jgi:hypothetical protein
LTDWAETGAEEPVSRQRAAVNRAQKTKSYLIQQLEMFKGYADLENSKDEFFKSVRAFRSTTVSYLRKTRIVSNQDIDRLDDLLADLDNDKTKGYHNQVYWNRVRPKYDNAKSILNDLIFSMDWAKVPFLIRCEDFAKLLFSEKTAIAIILIGISFLLGRYLDHLISFFKQLLH